MTNIRNRNFADRDSQTSQGGTSQDWGAQRAEFDRETPLPPAREPRTSGATGWLVAALVVVLGIAWFALSRNGQMSPANTSAASKASAQSSLSAPPALAAPSPKMPPTGQPATGATMAPKALSKRLDSSL